MLLKYLNNKLIEIVTIVIYNNKTTSIIGNSFFFSCSIKRQV